MEIFFLMNFVVFWINLRNCKRDPPSKNDNVRFTTILLKTLSDQVYKLDIHVSLYLNCLFSFEVFYERECFALRINGAISEINTI